MKRIFVTIFILTTFIFNATVFGVVDKKNYLDIARRISIAIGSAGISKSDFDFSYQLHSETSYYRLINRQIYAFSIGGLWGYRLHSVGWTDEATLEIGNSTTHEIAYALVARVYIFRSFGIGLGVMGHTRLYYAIEDTLNGANIYTLKTMGRNTIANTYMSIFIDAPIIWWSYNFGFELRPFIAYRIPENTPVIKTYRLDVYRSNVEVGISLGVKFQSPF